MDGGQADTAKRDKDKHVHVFKSKFIIIWYFNFKLPKFLIDQGWSQLSKIDESLMQILDIK